MNKSTSIIIPTLNEEQYLPHILGDLAMNKLDPTRVEIVVSDSGSTDRTAQVAAEFAQRYAAQLNLKFVTAPERGVSLARNNGVRHAEGERLIFLDADTRVSEDFVSSALGELEQRKLDAAGCYAFVDSVHWFDRLAVHLVRRYASFTQNSSHPLVLGAGMASTKALHEALGGFDQQLRFGEDLDYVRRAARLGVYRMLNSVDITFSARRVEDEGRLKTLVKALLGQYHYRFGDLRDVSFKYDFGKFSPAQRDEAND